MASSYTYTDVERANQSARSTKLPDYDDTQESDLERTSVKCIGAACFVLWSVLVFSWVVYAVPISWISDAPAFARSMLYLSVAHHTDQYRDYYGQSPPSPPPQFGDGRGNF